MLEVRNNTRWLKAAVIAVLLLASPSLVKAQDAATGTATATVVAALQVTATASLAFGSVIQGVPTTIAPTSASAGIFNIVGSGTLEILINLVLPEYLSSSSGDRMVITFAPTDGEFEGLVAADGTDFTAGSTTFNPYTTLTANLVANSGAVGLGGKVYPSENQSAGAYTADVTLMVSYTGN